MPCAVGFPTGSRPCADAGLQVNYVRVYQEPNATNLGCSPKDYPTAQWLAWCGRYRRCCQRCHLA